MSLALDSLPRDRAILLDKDGVLVDFHRTWKPAIKCAALAVAEQAVSGQSAPAAPATALAAELLMRVGHEPRTDTFLPGSIWAAGTQEELFDAWAALLPALPRQRIAETVTAILRATEPRPAIPLNELRALLEKVRAQGWKVAVVTNDWTDSAIATARRHGHAHLLDAVIGADQCARPKPHPDLVWRAAELLQVPAGGMVMVGDNVHDGEMARRGGCAGFIGVLSGTSGHADLAPLANAVAEDVAAALRLLLRHASAASSA